MPATTVEAGSGESGFGGSTPRGGGADDASKPESSRRSWVVERGRPTRREVHWIRARSRCVRRPLGVAVLVGLGGGDVDLMHEYRFDLAASSSATRFDDVSISPTLSTGAHEGQYVQPARRPGIGTPESGTRYAWSMKRRGLDRKPGKGRPSARRLRPCLCRDQQRAGDGPTAAGGFRRVARFPLHEQRGILPLRPAPDRHFQIDFVHDNRVAPNPRGDAADPVGRSEARRRVEVRQHPDELDRRFVNGVRVATAQDTTTSAPRPTGWPA